MSPDHLETLTTTAIILGGLATSAGLVWGPLARLTTSHTGQPQPSFKKPLLLTLTGLFILATALVTRYLIP